MFEIRPFPDFTWSYTRERALESCERLWYHLSYGSHNGWLRGAPTAARAAWVLKQLTTLPLALGQAVHRRAREAAEAVRTGRPLATCSEMVACTRQELNDIVRSSRQRAAFLASPKRHPMLHEVFYGIGLPQWQIERMADRLERCILALHDSPVWGELRTCEGGDVLLPEMPSAFLLHGVTVYAAPDLVYRTRGVWTIVDWKTGSTSGALEQIATYGLFLEYGLQIPFSEGRFCGRIIDLMNAEEHAVAITRDDLDRAAFRIRQSITRIRSLLADPETNAPKPVSAYRVARNTVRCPRCRFFALCRRELGFGPTGEQQHSPMHVKGAGGLTPAGTVASQSPLEA